MLKYEPVFLNIEQSEFLDVENIATSISNLNSPVKVIIIVGKWFVVILLQIFENHSLVHTIHVYNVYNTPMSAYSMVFQTLNS